MEAALTLAIGVGLVYWAIYFILTADRQITWGLVWQLPWGIVGVGAGLLLYGEAIWVFAKRDRATTLEARDPK